jgi:hypothetical protein
MIHATAAGHLSVPPNASFTVYDGVMNFRCDFDVTGDLVLPPGVNELTLRTRSGFVLNFSNSPADSSAHAPALLVCVIGPADAIDTAREQLQAALGTQLDLLSFATHSRFKISSPRRLIEWEDWQKTRQFDTFYAADPRYPPDPEFGRAYLETVGALDEAKPPEFARMALRYFRYGLLDEQPEDQFMRFWLALEIIAENVKERDRVPIACPDCSAALKCGQCGLEPTRMPMAKQAIEDLMARMAGSAATVNSKLLFRARNSLMHGKNGRAVEAECKTPLPQIVNELGAITWKAIMSSIALSEGPSLTFGHRGGEFVIPESGVKTTSSGLERLQPVDLAEYVVDQVS